MKDWPTLETAVETKIEDQKEFVRWWKETVRGKGEKANSADRGYFVDDAESLTGISHQQVSRWRNSLKDETKYRGVLYGPSYKKAMAGKEYMAALETLFDRGIEAGRQRPDDRSATHV